jgi:hypothetical protein
MKQPTCARSGRELKRDGVCVVLRVSSRKFGDVGSSSLRNAKGLTSACGPGRRLLSWRDHLARRSFGKGVPAQRADGALLSTRHSGIE